jgi:hypothetical protein
LRSPGASYVAGYDRKARFDPVEDLFVLRAYGLDANAALIDFGAGTGTFAVAAASVCERVIAVDVSPWMLDAIRKKAGAAGAANMDCVQAGFLSSNTRAPRPTSSTPGTRCTTFPTSGREPRSPESQRCFPGTGSFNSAISSSPSTGLR